MDKQILKAEVRKITGRKVKTLRKEGMLPGNVYGKKIKSIAVQVAADEFRKVYKEVGETSVFELEFGKDSPRGLPRVKAGEAGKRPVLIHEVQVDPVSDLPIHIDFLQVDLKEKITANIPVELSGESPAEKQALGTVVLYVNELEVKALPTDLPEKFVVDISKLTEVDQAFYVKDLSVNKSKAEITQDPETIIAKVEPPQKEEEVAPPAPAEGETPVEGEVPAEGEVAPEAGEQNPQESPAEVPKSARNATHSVAGGEEPKE